MLNQIPIKTILRHSAVFPGFFLAKSGVKIHNFLGQTQLISGFGFNKSKESAINSAYFETLEHLYATYDFQKDRIQKNATFYGIQLNNPNACHAFSPSRVLVGPVPGNMGHSTDANGLGCHIIYERAIEHALLEIVERHWLAQLWYGARKVLEIEKENLLFDSFRIRYFTLELLPIPFVIAIIDNQQEGIWALGSAARYSIGEALQHAQHEAMMLIESTLLENGRSYSGEIEQRILSLRNKSISRLRAEFFNSKITGRIKIDDITSILHISDAITQIFRSAKNIWLIDLCKCAELCVVKALCPQAQNPRWYRKKKLKVPYDPFC